MNNVVQMDLSIFVALEIQIRPYLGNWNERSDVLARKTKAQFQLAK